MKRQFSFPSQNRTTETSFKASCIVAVLFASLLSACSDGVKVSNSATLAPGPNTSGMGNTDVGNTDTGNTDTGNTDAGNADVNDSGVDNTDGGFTNATVTGNFSNLGMVWVRENAVRAGVTARAAFKTFERPFDVTEYGFNTMLNPTLDVCSARDVIDDTNDDENINIDTDISAGEVLPITSANGTYMSLSYDDETDVFVPHWYNYNFAFADLYENPIGPTIPGPMPGSMSIDIPGGEFPAIANAQIPSVVPLSMTSPAVRSTLTANSTFTWTPDNNPNSYIKITSGGGRVTGPNSSIMIVCHVADDGSFTFPADIREFLRNDFVSFIWVASRMQSRFQVDGDTLMILTGQSDYNNMN